MQLDCIELLNGMHNLVLKSKREDLFGVDYIYNHIGNNLHFANTVEICQVLKDHNTGIKAVRITYEYDHADMRPDEKYTLNEFEAKFKNAQGMNDCDHISCEFDSAISIVFYPQSRVIYCSISKKFIDKKAGVWSRNLH